MGAPEPVDCGRSGLGAESEEDIDLEWRENTKITQGKSGLVLI
jgi:hypothetical protein